MAATKPADFHQPQVQNIYGWYFATGRFENLKVKDLTSEANSQLRRGSTHSTTEPVTLKEKEATLHYYCYYY